MPGFVTHHIFGVNSYKKLQDKNIKSIIKKHHEVFALGLQGGDLFFYFLPSSSGIGMPKVGNKMHKEKTGEFFRQLIHATSTVTTNYDFEVCTAYILGYIGHYLLDTKVHPYVYFRVSPKISREILGIHFGLETDIDREVLFHYRGLKQTEFSHRKAINVSNSEQDVIAKLLHQSIFATYDLELSTTFIKAAIVSLKIETELLVDKNNTKHKIISFLEDITNSGAFFSPMLINDIEHMKDPCNTSNSEWYNPWNSDIKTTDSVFDIMDTSIDEYNNRIISMYNALYKAFKHIENPNPSILEELGNLSFTSGLDCNIPISRD